ncbi:MAG: 50S ribosomal protein L28 [Dehalococcoidales bacterium]|nr:50S ribosomal protein L28 [Dehalococcoidales bacterium]
MKCDICGKTPQFGSNVSHSKRHTNRRWDPNIHPAIVVVDGKRKRLNLCTRCLRTQQKETKKPLSKQSSPVTS